MQLIVLLLVLSSVYAYGWKQLCEGSSCALPADKHYVHGTLHFLTSDTLIWLLGGAQSQGPNNTIRTSYIGVHTIDLQTSLWSRDFGLQLAGAHYVLGESGRLTHASAYHRGLIYIVGGERQGNSGPVVALDVRATPKEEWEWKIVCGKGADCVAPDRDLLQALQGHTVSVLGDNLVVLGGVSTVAKKRMEGVWILQLHGGKSSTCWIQLPGKAAHYNQPQGAGGWKGRAQVTAKGECERTCKADPYCVGWMFRGGDATDDSDCYTTINSGNTKDIIPDTEWTTSTPAECHEHQPHWKTFGSRLHGGPPALSGHSVAVLTTTDPTTRAIAQSLLVYGGVSVDGQTGREESTSVLWLLTLSNSEHGLDGIHWESRSLVSSSSATASSGLPLPSLHVHMFNVNDKVYFMWNGNKAESALSKNSTRLDNIYYVDFSSLSKSKTNGDTKKFQLAQKGGSWPPLTPPGSASPGAGAGSGTGTGNSPATNTPSGGGYDSSDWQQESPYLEDPQQGADLDSGDQLDQFDQYDQLDQLDQLDQSDQLDQLDQLDQWQSEPRPPERPPPPQNADWNQETPIKNLTDNDGPKGGVSQVELVWDIHCKRCGPASVDIGSPGAPVQVDQFAILYLVTTTTTIPSGIPNHNQTSTGMGDPPFVTSLWAHSLQGVLIPWEGSRYNGEGYDHQSGFPTRNSTEKNSEEGGGGGIVLTVITAVVTPLVFVALFGLAFYVWRIRTRKAIVTTAMSAPHVQNYGLPGGASTPPAGTSDAFPNKAAVSNFHLTDLAETYRRVSRDTVDTNQYYDECQPTCQQVVVASDQMQNSLKTDSALSYGGIGVGVASSVGNFSFREMPSLPVQFTGEVLGRGTSATVYKGYYLTTAEPVALKKISGSLGAIEKEVQVLLSLSHPNIVRCHGMYHESNNVLVGNGGCTVSSEDHSYLVMEYCGQGALNSLLEDIGPLPLDMFADVTRQILLGLEYLHTRMLIHRDIKPGNILLTADGVVKISDFGTCKQDKMMTLTRDSRNQGTFVGTVLFMPPECSSSRWTSKGDVWSLGLTLLYLLTGCNPYKNSLEQEMTPLQIFMGVGTGQIRPEIPCTVLPEEIVAMLERCLELDPQQRASVSELMQHPALHRSFTPPDLTATANWTVRLSPKGKHCPASRFAT